jgi:Tfp pilus assembly protein FimT
MDSFCGAFVLGLMSVMMPNAGDTGGAMGRGSGGVMLLELLIAIGIIVLLVAILIPAALSLIKLIRSWQH